MIFNVSKEPFKHASVHLDSRFINYESSLQGKGSFTISVLKNKNQMKSESNIIKSNQIWGTDRDLRSSTVPPAGKIVLISLISECFLCSSTLLPQPTIAQRCSFCPSWSLRRLFVLARSYLGVETIRVTIS